MQVMDICLTTVGDVKDFVDIVNKAPYDVDLTNGRYTVDAKSIMGVSSLDLSEKLKVIMFAEDCSKLCAQLARFQVCAGPE